MLYVIFRFMLRCIYTVLFRLEPKDVHNIPTEGPVILASNHISNLDPPTIGVKVPRKVYFMAKEELFRIPVFGPLIKAFGAFPVKRGGVSKDAIKSAINLLKEGNVLGIFPEGSRKNAGAAKKGTAMIALRSGAPIVPVAIVGGYKLFRKTKVCYGKPIILSELIRDHSSSDTLEQATEIMMACIAELSREHQS